MVQKINDIESILKNELYKNPAITHAISSILVEYDIKSAHTTAIRYIYGEDKYNELLKLDKKERNITIGKWQIGNPTLIKELQHYLLLFKKTFIESNNIRLNNVVETTKDSILLNNKMASKLKLIIDGKEVEFSNKDGVYSSYYRINGKSILFDNLTKNIRIKGINNDIIKNSEFINGYFIDLLSNLEHMNSLGYINVIKNIKIHRMKYINNKNIGIYRSIDHNNRFIYNIGGDIIESEMVLPNERDNMVMINNYTGYVMPVMSCIV
jgi:hypothetical protein